MAMNSDLGAAFSMIEFRGGGGGGRRQKGKGVVGLKEERKVIFGLLLKKPVKHCVWIAWVGVGVDSFQLPGSTRYLSSHLICYTMG